MIVFFLAIFAYTCVAVHGLRYLNVTESPCNVDNSGTIDVTAALQACVVLAYKQQTVPVLPLFFPPGSYLVSDTIKIQQENPGPDDGVNVCPARFLPNILWGSSESLPSRPTIILAANSAGFAGSSYKPVVDIYCADGEGVDMNQLFRGIDIDLTREGNPGAVGISHPGAQGATVSDVTVFAGPDTFACFAGLNGAGGMHSNIKCIGARYGLYIDNSQPVPSGAGVTLINQTLSAIFYTASAQETLSLVGVNITVGGGFSANESQGVIVSASQTMSLVDVTVDCGGGGGLASIAVVTSHSLYLRDFYTNCAMVVDQKGAPPLPGPPPDGPSWLLVNEYARGVDVSPYYVMNVTYSAGGARTQGGYVLATTPLPGGAAQIPSDLLSRHVWEEAEQPYLDLPGVADAIADCGAAGDNATDDTAALQKCVNEHARVFLPPGIYRISATLELPAGAALGGMGNGASYILAASAGLPGASAGSPLPLLRTATADGGGGPTVLSFFGLGTWQHLPGVYTLDWQSRHPASLWRTLFEFRECECLWIGAYAVPPPAWAPGCQQPSNITFPKSQVRGLGRFHSFVNDDTGGILSTAASYRHLLIADTNAFATADNRTRFYSLNMEHAQAEANLEARNVSFLDIYSIKGEGNLPLIWLRAPASNVSILGLGGGIAPFPYNFTLPPDQYQTVPSIFRLDAGVGAKLAALSDHGYGASPPYWPPKGGGCKWGHHYPFPGASTPLYPYWTYPNVTMWNCWYGSTAADTYWHQIAVGGAGIQPCDKPIYFNTE